MARSCQEGGNTWRTIIVAGLVAILLTDLPELIYLPHAKDSESNDRPSHTR